jgi:hypothetical protein
MRGAEYSFSGKSLRSWRGEVDKLLLAGHDGPRYVRQYERTGFESERNADQRFQERIRWMAVTVLR